MLKAQFVRVDVDETDIAKVRIGARSNFTAQVFGEEKFWGRVVRIGQQPGKKNVDTEQPTEKAGTRFSNPRWRSLSCSLALWALSRSPVH